MRLAHFEWPASERCLARESSRRRLAAGNRVSAPSASASDAVRVSSMQRDMTRTVDRRMKVGAVARFFQQADLNFLLTNCVPRLVLTRAMGRLSRIESPWFPRAAIALWRLFTELALSAENRQRLDSSHDCFTRELRAGARTIDARPGILVSPCDAIVGACGRVERGQVFQVKGMPYAMADLFGPTQDTSAFEGGSFVTLRLT